MSSNQQTQNLNCTKGSWLTHSLFLCIVVMAANINPQDHINKGNSGAQVTPMGALGN